jgi:sugar lactone lactonase YvrE
MKIFKLSLIVLIPALAYLLLWPVPIAPRAWTPPAASDAYGYNEGLKGIEKLAANVGVGPEGISFDAKGRVYAGFEDGRVMRFDPDGKDAELLANTGGRPWGTHAEADGSSVLVADAVKGLLRVRAGAREVLATQADGVSFQLTDDVTRASDGTIYFSDASSKYGLKMMMADVFEHGNYGRLMRFDPAAGSVTTLLDGLHVANGVTLSPDEDFVLVAETLQYRVMRYWLKGDKAGTSDVFIDNLPGFPDNISYNGRDGYWLALFAPRDPALDMALSHPWLLKMIYRIPESLRPQPKKHAWALKLDGSGKLVADLQYRGDGVYAPITSVREVGDKLYFGSIEYPAIGRMPVPEALRAEAGAQS